MFSTAAKVALFVAFLAGLLSLSEELINTSRPTQILGSLEYDIEDAKAPILTGFPLTAFAYVGTQTPFGNILRRFLLIDNGITKLRELAAQMPEVPPLHHPMQRLSPSKLTARTPESPITVEDYVPFPPPSSPFSAANSDVIALHEAYCSASTTPTAVASKILKALPALQEKYRMFSTLPLTDSIESQAKASTARYASDEPLSIFDGVPVAFKDMIPIAGYVMTDGSAANTINANQTVDDLLVARFRELGAIILPPTSMTEGGVTPVGYSTYIQGPFNPYSTDHYSGGSSGGSAVAVALGLCPVAIGFDGGGSIRTPASLSGVLGLATGYGRFPFSSHLQGTLIKAGPFATKIGDLALAYSVLARHSATHNFFGEMYNGECTPDALLNELLESDSKDLKGVTLGVFDEWFNDADEEVVRRNREVLAELVVRGATVRSIKLPNMQAARMSHAFKITSEFAMGWDGLYSSLADLEPATRITVSLGSTTTALEVLAAEKMRAYFMKHWNDLFDSGVDVVLTPTTGVTAPRIPSNFDYATGESNTVLSVNLLKFVFPGNFLGLPGVAVPIGFDKGGDGMPISMQINGRQWEEDKALRVADAVAAVVEENKWQTKVPADRINLLA